MRFLILENSSNFPGILRNFLEFLDSIYTCTIDSLSNATKNNEIHFALARYILSKIQKLNQHYYKHEIVWTSILYKVDYLVNAPCKFGSNLVDGVSSLAFSPRYMSSDSCHMTPLSLCSKLISKMNSAWNFTLTPPHSHWFARSTGMLLGTRRDAASRLTCGTF